MITLIFGTNSTCGSGSIFWKKQQYFYWTAFELSCLILIDHFYLFLMALCYVHFALVLFSNIKGHNKDETWKLH